MLGDVTNTGASFVEMGKYIVKLVRLEDEGESQFKEGERRIKWTFHLAQSTADGPALLRQSDGEPYEFFAWNNGKMGPSSYARQWSEALLGRQLTEGESGGDIAGELLDKKAVALIGPNKNGRMSILQIEPMSAAKKPAATPAKPEKQLVSAATGGDGEF